MTHEHEHIEQYFAFEHLPTRLQEVSSPFATMAKHILSLPRNPERSVALRKLLESKDAAVRAAIAKDVPQAPPAPAPPSFGDVFNERDRQRADAEIALINAHFGGSES
jgi:hypothetical protein